MVALLKGKRYYGKCIMNYLHNPVLATIIYYDIFEYPLTRLEVHKFLVNPTRLAVSGRTDPISLEDVEEELEQLVNSGILGRKNGFYFLNRKENLYDIRMARRKIADQKWKKFLKLVKFLALAPYLRGIFSSGSMALYNTEDKSDYDVLIIARSGRLYTCRFFLWLISSFLGSRRKRYEKVAPDKLCFNHYLTDGDMELVHQSIFNAQTYVNLKPALIKPELIYEFYAANSWLNDYVVNFEVQKELVRPSIIAPSIFIWLARIVEIIIDSTLGGVLENFLKNLQQKRIKNNPATYQPGGRIVFNNRELEFHPRSFEAIVVAKYNQGLSKMGIVQYREEKDSGLL